METMSVRWRIAVKSDICPILDRYVSHKISVRLSADGQNDIGPMSFTIYSRYTADVGPMMARYRFADWVLRKHCFILHTKPQTYTKVIHGCLNFRVAIFKGLR